MFVHGLHDGGNVKEITGKVCHIAFLSQRQEQNLVPPPVLHGIKLHPSSRMNLPLFTSILKPKHIKVHERTVHTLLAQAVLAGEREEASDFLAMGTGLQVGKHRIWEQGCSGTCCNDTVGDRTRSVQTA